MCVTVELYVVSVNHKNGQIYYLDHDGVVPTLDHEAGTSLHEDCNNLIKKYTNLHPEWVDFHLYYVKDELGILTIQYVCVIPEQISLKYGMWKRTEDYELVKMVKRTI